MKLKNIGYKALALTIGAASLFSATSCKDYLDGEIYDNISATSFQTYDNAMALTSLLYGGKIWNDYECKFAWVMEGAAGNLYNTYQNEGMLYLLNVNADNDILLSGYKSLYAGCISTANQIINGDFSSLSETEKNEIIAEARLWRGLAHFYATEYWGEVPLVWNNEKAISADAKLQRSSRERLYKAIEQDFLFASENLPETRSSKYSMHATKWAAKAMLAKLYLQQAACVGGANKNSDMQYNYTCSDAKSLYEKVISLTTEVIDNGGFTLQDHASMFKCNVDMSNETILAFHYTDGEWAEGSQYQCQMANADAWSPGAGWGAGKGIAYTLYNDFDNADPRKKELCMYAGQCYYCESTNGDICYTSDDDAYALLSSIGVLNNVKKFVYGHKGSQHFMSLWARFDIVRLSDAYLMRQEAKMLSNGGVSDEYSDMSDLNTVLAAHGASTVSGSMAFYKKVEGEVSDITYTEAGTKKEYTSRNSAGNLHPYSDANKSIGKTLMYHNTHRTDFIQELRKEFAMEGHNWFDLKRLFYLSPEAATSFLAEQDRGCAMAVKNEVDPTKDVAAAAKESNYERLTLHNDILNQRIEGGESTLKVGDAEAEVNNVNFAAENKFFLPFPSSSEVRAKLDMGSVNNSEIEDWNTFAY